MRSLVFAMIPVIQPNNGYVQFFLILFTLVFSLAFQVGLLPYLDGSANRLATIELGFLIVILTLGSWFMGEHDYSNAATNKMSDTLGAFMCACVGLVFAVIAGVFVFVLWKASYPEAAENMYAKERSQLGMRLKQACTVLAAQEEEDLLRVVKAGTYIDQWHFSRMANYVCIEACSLQPNTFFDRRIHRGATELMNEDKMELHVSKSRSSLSSQQEDQVTRSKSSISQEGAGFVTSSIETALSQPNKDFDKTELQIQPALDETDVVDV